MGPSPRWTHPGADARVDVVVVHRGGDVNSPGGWSDQQPAAEGRCRRGGRFGSGLKHVCQALGRTRATPRPAFSEREKKFRGETEPDWNRSGLPPKSCEATRPSPRRLPRACPLRASISRHRVRRAPVSSTPSAHSFSACIGLPLFLGEFKLFLLVSIPYMEAQLYRGVRDLCGSVVRTLPSVRAAPRLHARHGADVLVIREVVAE